MSMETLIKEHLKKQAEQNEYFALKYKEEHMDKCMKFIYSKARQMANRQNCLALEENEVFRMAEDFFNDELEKILENESKAKESKEKSEWDSIGKTSSKPKKAEPSLFDFDD